MAGAPTRETLDSPSATRDLKHTQTSSSVPSTPYQKPRDYHFHSRSPSPQRGTATSSHSPKSVVSEAVGASSGRHHGGLAQQAHRGAPVVCKFETGDEIRKRRIPYVDGGHEELGPPKQEPRKHLEPDEREKLGEDMRELYDRLLPSAESEDRRARLVRKLERILNEEWPDNDIRVNVFGSSGNLLSSTDSDVDICITTPLKKLESMHSLATLLSKHGMEKVVCRAAAKVPIVKCWDPELELSADLNVNNPLALQNTKMIKTYVQLDDRVRPLAKIIKYWTKQRILNDAAFGGTISSYTWICMIISFLQRREPPVLPSLQKIEDCRLPSQEGEASPFADDLEALKARGNENKESLGELLFQFFRHYGYEFEYSKSVVSVREGRLVSRQEKGWEPTNYHDKEARNRLCVEEPFTVNRNLGNSADDYAWHGIHGEIRRAFDLLSDGLQLEKCCEQYVFPPEEKHIFQRPPPKPKPILTRSASQSSRPEHQQGNGRSRKSNRNQSAQRNSNRRASSGASLGATRMAMPFASPTIGVNPSDYFGVKGNLHEQLFQQYQFLQMQQDALRSQLQAHAQQQAAQAQARGSDVTGSPRPRPLVNGLSSGLSSPRGFDMPPQTAPLLPGYLYHYPAQYLPSSPISAREGTPSSPSLTSASLSLRRQVHRASAPDVASGRSQSQPGRSLPNPVSMQQQVHPGYDVSGAIYPPYRFLPQTVEPSIPKEYVGYYVGQSPQLEPQAAQMPPPPLTLQDPPQRARRVTPELATRHGRRESRSPSPLSQLRSYSINSDRRSPITSPTAYEPAPVTAPLPDLDFSGPIIVNGSNRTIPKPASLPNGVLEQNLHQSVPQQSFPATNGIVDVHEAIGILPVAAPLLSPVAEQRTPSPTRTRSYGMNASAEGSPLTNGNYAAQVAANAHAHAIGTTHMNGTKGGKLQLGGPIVSASSGPKDVGGVGNQENRPPHERKPSLTIPPFRGGPKKESTPSATRVTLATSAMPPSTSHASTGVDAAAHQNQNPWQQATRKGHKKSKSVANASGVSSAGVHHQGGRGLPMPANESERKGG